MYLIFSKLCCVEMTYTAFIKRSMNFGNCFNFVSEFKAAQLSAFKCHKEEVEKHLICLVVDSGYSFTHIVPVFNGKVLKKGVKR